MRSSCVLAVVISAALAGCTVLHSTPDLTEGGGIAYHLPRTMIVAKVDLWRRVKDSPMPDKYVVTIDTSTRGETIPDHNERFVLKYNSNPFFHDRFCVLTTENGLLRSVEYATEDATPNIALSLADLVRKAGAAGFSLRSKPADVDPDPVTSANVTFNPFDPYDRKAAAEVINNVFSNRVRVQFDFPELERHFSGPQELGKCNGDKGLCFRTKVTTPMRLRDLSSGTYTASVPVDVVNLFHVGHFDLDRAFMVEKVVRLGFDNGALTQVIMRKPSEVLQTVKVPLAVVDAILAVPANAIATATTGTQISDKLKQQRDQIDKLHRELAAGVAHDDSTEPIYRPKCKGRTGLLNPNG